MSGDIKLSVGSDLVRSLGCNDLCAGKKFTLLLGTDTNMLTYTIPNSGLPVPIKIKTDVGFGILINELPICVFSREEILCSRPIDIEQHSIKNVKNPVEWFDAVNKAYVDRVHINHLLVLFLILLWQTTHSSHFPMRKVFQVKIQNNRWDMGRTVARGDDFNIQSNVRNWVARLSQVYKRPIPYVIFPWFSC